MGQHYFPSDDEIMKQWFNGYTFEFNDAIRVLTAIGTSVSTTIKTFHNALDASNYQVPSDKKFIPILIGLLCTGVKAGYWLKIGYSDVADTNTGIVQQNLFKDHIMLPENMLYVPLEQQEIPSGKYPGYYSTGNNSVFYPNLLIGVERSI